MNIKTHKIVIASGAKQSRKTEKMDCRVGLCPPRNDGSGWVLTVTLIVLLSFSVSSCGMKRALTLPKKEEQAMLMQDLTTQDSIDGLKTN
jgi:predicted small lipoprotein YifL